MRASLWETAYAHIKDMVLQGPVQAGGWLSVGKIASELGASRQPVMDAMKRLVLHGFIEIVPQVGCQVRHPDPKEIEDVHRLFGMCEALVAEMCAVRASASDVISLQLISSRIGGLAEIACADARAERYHVLNRRFHAELRRISKSPALSDISESLEDRSDFYVALTYGAAFDVVRAHHEHERLIEAIAAGDASAARAAMERHIVLTDRPSACHREHRS